MRKFTAATAGGLLSAGLLLGISGSAGAETVYEFHQVVQGMKAAPCADLGDLTAVSDGMHRLCHLGRTASRNKQFAVIGGHAFELSTVGPAEAFSCPAGSRYMTDAEAIKVSELSGDGLPAYTPLNSFAYVTSTSVPEYNKGWASTVDAEGNPVIASGDMGWRPVLEKV